MKHRKKSIEKKENDARIEGTFNAFVNLQCLKTD